MKLVGFTMQLLNLPEAQQSQEMLIFLVHFTLTLFYTDY